MPDRLTLESRLEYWNSRLMEAEAAVEVAKEQIDQAQLGLGMLALQEMIDSGTLKEGINDG